MVAAVAEAVVVVVGVEGLSLLPKKEMDRRQLGLVGVTGGRSRMRRPRVRVWLAARGVERVKVEKEEVEMRVCVFEEEERTLRAAALYIFFFVPLTCRTLSLNEERKTVMMNQRTRLNVMRREQ